MSRLAKVALGSLAALVLIQLISFERTNPPIAGEIEAPADIKPLLKRACYDCHSNETTWPWYSRVAPVSWLVHRDVVEGRKHLNFSTWAGVAADRKAKKLDDLVEEVEGGDMPPWFYLPMHPQAKLTTEEQQTILRWARHAGEP